MSESSTAKYLIRDPQGNVYGPADEAMLRDWVTQGRIVPGMHIAPQGTQAWVEATAHPAIADMFQRPPAGGPGMSPTVRPIAAPTVAASPALPVAGTPVNRPAEVKRETWETPVRADQSPLSYSPGTAQASMPGLISFICGLVGMLGLAGACFPVCMCVAGPVTFFLALAAIVLGSVALFQIKANPQRFTGRGLAVAGLSLGILILLIDFVIIIMAVIHGVHLGP